MKSEMIAMLYYLNLLLATAIWPASKTAYICVASMYSASGTDGDVVKIGEARLPIHPGARL